MHKIATSVRDIYQKEIPGRKDEHARSACPRDLPCFARHRAHPRPLSEPLPFCNLALGLGVPAI